LKGLERLESRYKNAEGIYEVLRKKILHLEYKPGLVFSALTLSNEMNVSRSPARDVLIKLAAADLVEIFPQVGSRVALINLSKVSEERFLRKSLEESALKDFVNDHIDKDINKMRNLINEQIVALEEKDFIRFILLDNDFHKIIFTAINKPRCWSLMDGFGSNEFRLRLLSCHSVNNTTQSVIDNHEQLLDAIEKRNISKALKISHKHLSRISDEIPKLLEMFPDIFSEDNSNLRFQRNISNLNENFLKSL